MTCADLETLLCDYVEGTLAGPQRLLVERHLAQCAACAAQVREARAAWQLLRSMPRVEAPPELVNRILFQLPPHADVRTPSPAGLRAWCTVSLRALVQPRFAMGMAMTILSFSILGRFAGLGPRQLSPAELHPAQVIRTLEDTAYRAWDRARKFYLSLRVVYEIQSQLHEWSQQLREEASLAAPAESSESLAPAAPSIRSEPHSPQAGQSNNPTGGAKP
ncbi:MAG: anti-sigma factor family protein [Bryobacteraceae bacterium]